MSSAFFSFQLFSNSAAQGAKSKVLVTNAALIVPTATTIHRSTTEMENIVPKTLKNKLGSSFAIVVVDTVKTPKGKVNLR